MRSDGPLLLAIVFLGIGIGVMVGFGDGHTGFNAAYPFTGSMVHFDLTTTGPGVLGAAAAGAVGALCLVWAIFAAIVGLISGPATSRERVVERVSVVPRVVPRDETETYDEATVPERRPHFWSRHRERTNF
ncbi:MAG TPA: hypothetical protein VL986_13180 [Terracidiphilus sp.]|nr:hypothetical protein [Terracidiphilus sp.]